MSLPTKVVFPAPPPTTNDLTAQQRALLVRKTKKIEQLLGSTPFLVDPAGPIHISLPSTLSKRRSSVDSNCSNSSSDASPTRSLIRRSHSSMSSFSTRSSDSRRSRYRSTPSVTSSKTSERWPKDNKIPILRLAMRSLNIESIPASPPPSRTSFCDPTPSPTTSDDEFTSVQFLQDPTDLPSPHNSLVLTTFTIPSENSLRKQKMDRLRKKLGSGVPLQLVFPKDAESDSENSPSSPLPPVALSIPFETTASRSPSLTGVKRSTPRIAKARDSLVDSSLIHRAKRLVDGPPPQTRATPPAPPTIPIPGFKRVKDRLSLIVESPDEHGNRCSEEFGLSRVSSKTSDSSAEFQSERHGANLSMWSTRRGYEGWAPVIPPKDDIRRRLSIGEGKKRPLSYRKPAPPVSGDC